jgi:MtN3 and saliva related transmembrane protein
MCFEPSAMSNPWVSVVGTAAATCSMASFVPQIVKIVREHDASAVSLRMYMVTVVGFGFWITYGLMIASWPVVVSNAISLALSGAILALKWRLSSRPATAGARPARGSA